MFNKAFALRKGNGPTQGQRKTDLGWILFTVAPSAELQGQNDSKLWVLEVLFHRIKASHNYYYMANPVVGKPCALIGSFSVRILQYGTFSWKRSNPCIFVLKQTRQIQNLQPRQRQKSVKIVILHIETTSRS